VNSHNNRETHVLGHLVRRLPSEALSSLVVPSSVRFFLVSVHWVSSMQCIHRVGLLNAQEPELIPV